MNNNTLFTIAIPAYKSKFLGEAIKSCLSQTYSNFELLIVDDASPDDLKSVVDGYRDGRIRFYRNEKNCGAVDVVDNWNICLSYAKGDYVICMGDDDRLLPNCLEEYAQLIEKYPGIGLLHGWTEIINEHSEVTALTTHRCEYESVISLAWHRSHAYELQFIGDFCFNTEWLRSQGGFYKLPLAWGSDDISAYIGAMKNGVANTQKVVFQYRRNSLTISSTGNVNEKMNAIMKEFEWKQQFLTTPCKEPHDELYRKELISDLQRRKGKKQGLTLACDLKKKRFRRLLHWYCNRKKYDLTFQILVYALMQSYKK